MSLCCKTRTIFPGAVINCRPVGVLIMEDDGGKDEKLIAVPSGKVSRRYEEIVDCQDLPSITLEQIQHFFERYKDLEPGKWVKIQEWVTVDHAKNLITELVQMDSDR